MTITARTVAGRETSSNILVAPGQPGWDGSLDGTYRVNPADPNSQSGAATPAAAAAFLNYLSTGPSLYGDSFYSELVGRVGNSPQKPTGPWVDPKTVPPAPPVPKVDWRQKQLNKAISATRTLLQNLNPNGKCAKFLGPNALAAFNDLAKMLVIASDYSAGVDSSTGIRQTYASTYQVNVNNVLAYRLPTSAEVIANGPFFAGLGKGVGGLYAGLAWCRDHSTTA